MPILSMRWISAHCYCFSINYIHIFVVANFYKNRHSKVFYLKKGRLFRFCMIIKIELEFF